MTKADQIQYYMDFVRPHYCGKDVGHDFRHIERIISRLDELKEGLCPVPVLRKLNFLACFHGLLPKMQSELGFKDEAVNFLKGLGWELQEIEESLNSLVRHLTAPETSEEMIVHDANYLEVVGALGAAKAFLVGGARSQTYEQTLQILEANLDKVSFKTPYGIKHYEEKRSYSRQFIATLKSELCFSSA